MRTHRTLPAVALIAVATIGVAACVAVNELVNGRDLVCGTTPDDLCLRLVDLALNDPGVPAPDRQWATRLTVESVSCEGAINELTAMSCWMIDGATDGGVVDGFRLSGFRTLIYRRADGTLVVWP